MLRNVCGRVEVKLYAFLNFMPDSVSGQIWAPATLLSAKRYCMYCIRDLVGSRIGRG
jgi:hypothetical protein